MPSVAKPLPAAGQAQRGTPGPGEEPAGRQLLAPPPRPLREVGHQKALLPVLPVDHE